MRFDSLKLAGPQRAGFLVQKEDRVPSGTVKWFNRDKGFGFIGPDDGSADVFLHGSALRRAKLPNLREGQRVTYKIEEGRDGKTAASDLKLI